MDLLPAIDLRQGQVVRLRQGDDARRTVYGTDPGAVLEGYAAAGARWVHVVDLDGAFGDGSQRELTAGLAAQARALGLDLELGGGLRDRASVLAALEAGCSRLVVGSMLARDFDLFVRLADELPGRLVPGLDLRDGRLGVDGWQRTSDLGVEVLGDRLRGLPCPAVLVTDIARDGELGGPNLELACAVGRATGMPALLSGGVHSLDDLRRASERPEIGGAVVGRALYDGRLDLAEALVVCGAGAVEAEP
ncbi:MAG: 1-(5-phosphoribosyl)-5-((5-phosphoribosylamino)methylideneamino)imidazole-4-carboxamide isomerase [Acidobacteria bacterium]|nr:1-(5-phosphoribosyl)-5-((5-phosphoribosylamino)methylideneamino)imidazole-4-carboxamide isomerase [Acidobacteriota bacterium]